MSCPICGCDKYSRLFDLDCGNFDDSKLYRHIKLNSCNNCGHVYNELTDKEKADLITYYTEECAPTNLSPAVSDVGDRPGSCNSFTVERYERLFNLFSRLIDKDSRILDVGCSMGGFLDFLNKRGFENLYGIDVSKGYVDVSKGYNIKYGNAESIPFEDNFFDVVILDQVMEHIQDLKRAIIEVKRVLIDGGLVCIGVPDASEYDKSYFFDYFWILLREHIQHFDLEHLKILLEGEDFKLIKFIKTRSPMISEQMMFVNLNALFYLNKNEKNLDLRHRFKKYLRNQLEWLEIHSEAVDILVESKRPVYFWGISREFLYLYANTELRKCNIVGLIDDITFKQENFLLDGRKIMDSSILKDADPTSVLLITAFAHKTKIKKKAIELGYKGDIL